MRVIYVCDTCGSHTERNTDIQTVIEKCDNDTCSLSYCSGETCPDCFSAHVEVPICDLCGDPEAAGHECAETEEDIEE